MSVADGNELARLSALLERRRGRVHFVGACGIGMAGLACILKKTGFDVDGCDLTLNSLAAWLGETGVTVLSGHDPAHVDAGPDLVVRSAAVAVDSPEILRALDMRIDVFSRGEVLSHLELSGLVAVGGTHGKTTTSAFIAQLLRHAGRDPTWCVGGRVSGCGCNGVAGVGNGDAAVLEADESDGTLALYKADIAVVTNIELDHTEHFGGEEALAACFRTFVQNARTLVYCGDDEGAAALGRERDHGSRRRSASHGGQAGGRGHGSGEGSQSGTGRGRRVSYGFSEGCDLRATDVAVDGMSQEFTLVSGGDGGRRARLNAPGRHNIRNALAAVAVGMELELTMDEIVAGLAEIRLPGRRFEVVASAGGVNVVSDYAHHPSEIGALIDAARCLKSDRVTAIFQPHRYTRTLALGD